MVFVTTIIPRYAETDKMGIIHHSVYPIYFEQARVDLCNEIGLPFHKIEERGLSQAIVDLKVKYIRPARFGDVLRLETKITLVSKVKIIFSYQLYNDDNVLINEGSTLLAWLNKDLRPTNITKEHNDIYELLLKYQEN